MQTANPTHSVVSFKIDPASDRLLEWTGWSPTVAGTVYEVTVPSARWGFEQARRLDVATAQLQAKLAAAHAEWDRGNRMTVPRRAQFLRACLDRVSDLQRALRVEAANVGIPAIPVIDTYGLDARPMRAAR